MLQLINKAAITVIPKEPFIKWVQSTYAKAAEISDEDILLNSQVYLVDASEDGDDPEKLIKRNSRHIGSFSVCTVGQPPTLGRRDHPGSCPPR